ncbi:MAG: PmoA family protein [Planctomycetota bacterium]
MKQALLPILVLSCCMNIPVSPGSGGELNLTETDSTIRITQRGKPVLVYNKTAPPVPDGVEEHFRRSGYIHPAYSPTGQEITGDYPLDHAHQHALFFAWTKSTYKGRKVDFWNQAKDLGQIEFRKVLGLTRDDRSVSFTVQHAFKVRVAGVWEDVLHETWTVTVHQTPADHFLFDIASVQRCVSDHPLTLDQYHYGGMAIRGNYQWLKEKQDHGIQPGDVQYLTSDGKDRWEGNHTRPNWVAFSGLIDGQPVSTAVFSSPKNFRSPQTVRIHPNKPYFCFAPMVEGEFKITPGEGYQSRYRYLVTSAATDASMVENHWDEYETTEK